MRKLLPRGVLLMVGTMICCLAATTVIERTCGGEAARAVYRSWQFASLWAIIAVSGITLCFIRRLHRQPAIFALHVALFMILAGAALTWLSGTSGKIRLTRGDWVDAFQADDGTDVPLPFGISLARFEMQCYEGTQTPSAFVADISFARADGMTESRRVSLNHAVSRDGYRFCLSGYGEDGNGATLTVTHDPLGIAITHLGYLLLLLAMIAGLFSRQTRFRARCRRLSSKTTGALLLFAALPALSGAEPRVLPENVADDFGRLYVLHGGRICPFETMAREVTTKLCGKSSYRGYSACQVVTGWWFYYNDWSDEPMIKLKSRQIGQTLGVRSKHASLNDFFDDRHNYRLQAPLAAPTKDLLDANEKCQVAMALGLGSLFRVMPLRRGNDLLWCVPGTLEIPTDIAEGKWTFVKNGMNYFNELVVREDWAECRFFIGKLHKYQRQEGGGLLPSASRMRAELLYNRLEVVLPCAAALLLTGLISLPATLCRSRQGRRLVAFARVAVVSIFIGLSLLLALRWYVGGHLPMSNGYETMLFMSWCALALTPLSRRVPIVQPLGSLAAGFAMLVAHISHSNPAVTPLMPVLNSPWLCLHVAVIMIAYALLALLTINSVCALIVHRRDPENTSFLLVGQVLLYPAVFSLAVGIFIGAVWAGVSWGSYWSWDPKETWALITLLIYAMPLHETSLPRFRRPVFFHAYMVAAFLSVAVTYWGVNNLFGGMHSYA